MTMGSEAQQCAMLDMVAQTTCNVLKYMMKIDVALYPIDAASQLPQQGLIIASVRFSGDIHGLFSCEVEQGLGQDLVANMMSMEAGSLVDPRLVGSAIGELVNVIAGNTLADKKCEQLKVSLTPPELSMVRQIGAACDNNQVSQLIELPTIDGIIRLTLTDMLFLGDVFNGLH